MIFITTTMVVKLKDGGVSRHAFYYHRYEPYTNATLISFVHSDGRLEDGYLAWSSIFLHECFGFIIYTPLTEEEEDKVKRHQYIPDWMGDFFSLPNLAIPLSYFCIGVALQLLRTPLIVYFIQDLGASAAEVNVLFTVSK